jgi:hypothetical protein
MAQRAESVGFYNRDRVRTEVERELGTQWTSSAFTAAAILVGSATLCSFVGGGLALLNRFSGQVMGWLAFSALLAAIVGFMVLEFTRMRRRSELLKDLLQSSSEDMYAGLLAEARSERDEATSKVRLLEGQLAVFASARELVGGIAVSKRSSPRRRLTTSRPETQDETPNEQP